jgi:uncharacterized protein
MFLGREYELAELNNMYSKEGFKFAVIYGRRRVGKTSLINEFCKDKENIFYIAIEQNDKAALEGFSTKVFELFPDANKLIDAFQSWEKAFEYIADQAENRKIVLAIDEYPYLANGNHSVSSILQKHIDISFKKSKIFLILCGSSMSFMENQVLGYKSPLYGRRTAQFKIEPFDYFDSSLFFENSTNLDKVLAYAAVGGIPQYLGIISQEQSIEKGIFEGFFKKSGHLYEEPENLLKQELREPAVYNSIITAIANGASRLNEISTKTGEEGKKCSKYLKSLIDLQIVEKEYPQGVKTERNSIYKLKDNMFRFWYRFIPKNITNIESGLGEQVFKIRVMPNMSEYIGRIFEDISVEYLIRRNKTMSLPFMFNTIGRWWGTNPKTRTQEEIDILAEYEENAIFGECKWKNEPVGINVLIELMEKAAILKHYKNNTYMIFSKSGFTKEILKKAKENGNVELIELDMMFNMN